MQQHHQKFKSMTVFAEPCHVQSTFLTSLETLMLILRQIQQLQLPSKQEATYKKLGVNVFVLNARDS